MRCFLRSDPYTKSVDWHRLWLQGRISGQVIKLEQGWRLDLHWSEGFWQSSCWRGSPPRPRWSWRRWRWRGGGGCAAAPASALMWPPSPPSQAPGTGGWSGTRPTRPPGTQQGTTSGKNLWKQYAKLLLNRCLYTVSRYEIGVMAQRS